MGWSARTVFLWKFTECSQTRRKQQMCMNARVLSAARTHELIIIGNKSGAPRASSFELGVSGAYILIKAATSQEKGNAARKGRKLRPFVIGKLPCRKKLLI